MKILALRILNKLKLLRFLKTTCTIQLNKKIFTIPIIEGRGFNHIGTTEPWMSHILKSLNSAKFDGAFFDIGVNIGQTLIKIKSINPLIEYIGFEPNTTCINYLHKLISVNQQLAKSTLIPVGISDLNEIKILNFYSPYDTDSSASIISNFRPNEKIYHTEFIPCYNFQTIQKSMNFPPIGILKVDVEGAEFEVIKAFEEQILRDQPIVIIEILPVYNISNSIRLERQQSLEEIFCGLDYSIFRIRKNQNASFDYLERVESIGIHNNLDYCDYIIAPKSKENKITDLLK